jgi:hypothetical protein
MSQELFRLASRYAQTYGWTKTAGRKKIERKQTEKELVKLEKKYSELHAEYKIVDKEFRKLELRRSELLGQTKSLGRQIKDLTNILNEMKLSGASGAMRYDDGDLGYIIDGKEFHIEINDSDDVNYVLMREHRKAKKRALSEEEKQELQAEGLSEEEIAEIDVPQDSSNTDDSFPEPDLNDESLRQFLEQF